MTRDDEPFVLFIFNINFRVCYGLSFYSNLALFMCCSFWKVYHLQGVSPSKAKAEITEMIADINLTDKTNAQSSTLSGGMKRKLW